MEYIAVNIQNVFPLTGFAKEAIVLSSSESQEEQSYNLIWRTESRAHVSRLQQLSVFHFCFIQQFKFLGS